MSMKTEDEDVGTRIKSLFAQLQHESTILDKIVYKGKNQHWRAFYFQYLLKVRRDVKLLQSANLNEILNFIFQVTNKEKFGSSAKRRKLNSEKHHFQMRLLGVARLLSQMVEPTVKAAIEFSSLLARSFFMTFSLTILALLARLRVLVQQILLDLVSLFNTFSSYSQGGQSTVVNIGGVEVVREYHPSDNDVIALECVWETDKFILLEKTTKTETRNLVKGVADGIETTIKSSNIKYQTITAFLGDDELDCPEDAGPSSENLSGNSKDRSHVTDASPNQFSEMAIGESDDDDDVGREGSPEKNIAEGDIKACTSPFPSQKLQSESESRRKVAFVSVTSQRKESGSEKEDRANCLAKAVEEKEDSFFSLLAAGQIKDSLF